MSGNFLYYRTWRYQRCDARVLPAAEYVGLDHEVSAAIGSRAAKSSGFIYLYLVGVPAAPMCTNDCHNISLRDMQVADAAKTPCVAAAAHASKAVFSNNMCCTTRLAGIYG